MTCACKMRRSRHGFAASIVWSPSNWTSGDVGNGRRRKLARCRLGRDFAGGSSHRLVASHDHGGTEGTEAFVEEPGESLRHVYGLRVADAGHLTESDPGLLEALERLIEPATRGDPMSPLRWTCKSTAKLAEELTQQNHPVSDRTVATAAEAERLQLAGQPQDARRLVAPGPQCSVRVHQPASAGLSEAAATRHLGGHEEEGIGRRIQESGRGMAAQGPAAKPVNVHDFPDKKLGKAIPYGVYDLACNEGWVSVGIDHDTAEFACASIYRWWNEMGSARFPRATKLLITADGGGSNSSRNRLWKKSLQCLADELGHDLERLSLSARHQQVEQDRASAVLLHYQELARASAHHLRGHRQSDRKHDHKDGPHGSRRAGPTPIRNRHCGQRRRTRPPPHHASKIPRRMELLHQAAKPKTCKGYFFALPN